MPSIQLSQAKSAYVLLFIFLALLLIAKTSTRNVEASASNAPNSEAQATPTPAATKGRVNGKIAFISSRHGRGLNIWTMNPDGSNPTRVTNEKTRGPALPPFSPVSDIAPIWSNDGSKIASPVIVMIGLRPT